MVGTEYREYWKQQKKIMEDGEKLIQHLKNRNILEDNKIENVSSRIVHLAKMREGVKEKEKNLISRRSEYESVEEKELVLKVLAEQKMVHAEAETEREWAKLLMEDKEQKKEYRKVLNTLSESVRDKKNLVNISDDNVKALYQDCFTVEAMLAFETLSEAAKQRFEKQYENKKLSSKARGYFVQAIKNEKELKNIAFDYKDVIPDFTNIETVVKRNKRKIRQAENEVENLARELKDENSEYNQKYQKRLEEFSIKGNEQKEQHLSLENKLRDIDSEIRTLRDEMGENERTKEEFERKREELQQSIPEYDKLIKDQMDEIEFLVQKVQWKEQMSDAERKETAKEISARKDILAENTNNKSNCENQIQGYTNSIQNMEKSQSELRDALKAKVSEREQVEQELHQVEEAYQANNADIENLKVQYRKDEEELKNQREKKEEDLKELKEQSEMLEKAQSDMNVQFLFSETNTKAAFEFEAKTREARDPEEIDKRKIYRDMANKVKAACKKFLAFEGDNKEKGHSNSDQFKEMMTKLDNIQKLGDEESLNMETYIDQLKTAAQSYKDAKNSQWFHFIPSNMRLTRLAMADGLISYCDQMKKQYELLGEMTGQVKPLPSATANWKKFDKMMELNRKAQISPDNCSEMIKKMSCKKMDTYAKERRGKEAEFRKRNYSFVDSPIWSNDQKKPEDSVDMAPMNNI